jgi:hypothetical protein
MQLPTVLFAIPRYFGIPTAKKNGAKRKKNVVAKYLGMTKKNANRKNEHPRTLENNGGATLSFSLKVNTVTCQTKGNVRIENF